MVSVKIYVEGGGNSSNLHSRCREGFRGFLEQAGFRERMPRIVACGGRRAAYDKFRIACQNNETALLLIDSEDFVTVNSPWEHLKNRPQDRFDRPVNATDDHCHLMVVCMESWFLADTQTLAKIFGQGFNANALPPNLNIENITKQDIYSGLRKAAAQCPKNTSYHKGKMSFKILGQIAPEKVCKESPWAKRFIEQLANMMI